MASREIDGKVSVIVQYHTITDFQWDVSGSGAIFPFIDVCGAWAPGANFVRNYATINLSNPSFYELATYVACDFALTATLSPSGKWYVASFYFDPIPNLVNTVIQRVELNSLLTVNWASLYNAYLPYANRMDEIDTCNLRVAAEGSVFGGNRLRLFSFACFDFSL